MCIRDRADTAPYIAQDGYHYWASAGGPDNGGFACVTSVASAGDGLYMAIFDVYGAGAAWGSEEMCIRDSLYPTPGGCLYCIAGVPPCQGTICAIAIFPRLVIINPGITRKKDVFQ